VLTNVDIEIAARKMEKIQKDLIIGGHWLNDDHIDTFEELLAINSSFGIPAETWRIYFPDEIRSIPQCKKHIQLLYSSDDLTDRNSPNGHWVCSYYDTKKLFIYDSLGGKNLHEHHRIYLQQLYPNLLDLEKKKKVVFPQVDLQPNNNDCGVYAIAFAVSILYGLNPENVRYKNSAMRQHLSSIFETRTIEHFPRQVRDNNLIPSLASANMKRKACENKALWRAKKTKSQHTVQVNISKTCSLDSQDSDRNEGLVVDKNIA